MKQQEINKLKEAAELLSKAGKTVEEILEGNEPKCLLCEEYVLPKLNPSFKALIIRSPYVSDESRPFTFPIVNKSEVLYSPYTTYYRVIKLDGEYSIKSYGTRFRDSLPDPSENTTLWHDTKGGALKEAFSIFLSITSSKEDVLEKYPEAALGKLNGEDIECLENGKNYGVMNWNFNASGVYRVKPKPLFTNVIGEEFYEEDKGCDVYYFLIENKTIKIKKVEFKIVYNLKGYPLSNGYILQSSKTQEGATKILLKYLQEHGE